MPGRSVWLRVLGVLDSVLESLVEEPDGSGVGCAAAAAPSTTRARVADAGVASMAAHALRRRSGCTAGHLPRAWGGRCPGAVGAPPQPLAFEDQVAWLATQCSQKACSSELMRLDWQTVGRIITRVVNEASHSHDRLDGLERIGIDEISWRTGQRYLTLVVDHASGRLVWAAEGRSRKVVDSFFEQLGPEQCAQLSHVSSDGAAWILGPVEAHCPNATICLDPFHVVQWATNALDQVRRQLWNEVRRSGQQAAATELKGSRWALLRNPEHLTQTQAATLALIAKLNAPLYRAYLLKEQLRMVFHVGYDQAVGLLERWLQWARRCRIGPFVALARTITYYRADIQATLRHGVNNGRMESLNTKVRLIARRAFGFHSANALIALSELTLGGLCPSLPGRQPW